MFWIWRSASISLIWAMSQMKWGSELQGHVGNVCWEEETQAPRPWSWSSPGCWRNQTLLKFQPLSGVQDCWKTASMTTSLHLCIPLFVPSFKKHFSRSPLCARYYLHGVIQRWQGISLFLSFPHPQEIGPFPNILKSCLKPYSEQTKDCNQPCSITPTIP